jgi:hypothetical protein
MLLPGFKDHILDPESPVSLPMRINLALPSCTVSGILTNQVVFTNQLSRKQKQKQKTTDLQHLLASNS